MNSTSDMKRTTDTDPYIKAILEGNPHKIKELYTSMFPKIRNYIMKNSGSFQDAEDVFQDALMLIYKKTSQENFSLPSKFSPYFMQVCKNIWRNKLNRKEKKVTNLVTISELDKSIKASIEESLEKIELQRFFHHHLAQLKTNCQKILTMFFDGKSFKEIGKILKITDAAARKRKHRCQKELSKNIHNDPVYGELKTK